MKKLIKNTSGKYNTFVRNEQSFLSLLNSLTVTMIYGKRQLLTQQK